MTQDEALSILAAGANVFLTGEPGSGKTHTINRYVAYLRARGVEPAITASTGIAATHIGGKTIHSWSGIGVRKTLVPKELDKIARSRFVTKWVKPAKVLIIDEISMLDAGTFTLVDRVCRKARASEEPFGGLQVVVVGDFFQLPPITPRGESPQFAFQSETWKAVPWAMCYLSEQHRQDDADFLSLLAAIRADRVEPGHVAHVDRRLLDMGGMPDDITRLFPHNHDVDRINDDALRELPGEPVTYVMADHGPERLVETLKKGCLSPEILKLKKNAIVMFTKNHMMGRYVNGTLGTVEGFESDSGYPIVRTRDGRRIEVLPAEWAVEEDGEVVAGIEQLPLRLAWAMTVHKSQGMSLDAAVMDLRQVFEYGQGYVALSRVRRLSGLHLLGYNRKAFQVHPDILAIDQHFRERSEAMVRAVSALSPEELSAKWERFIRFCGGKPSLGDEPSAVVKHRPKILEDEGKTALEREAVRSKLEAVREKHPNAYRPWRAGDDELLKKLFAAEMSLEEISQELGRQPGSIRNHMKKIDLVDDDGHRIVKLEG